MDNLPAQLTTFVGRGRELRDIGELVGRRRLVTLTGAGGCGKTRLALQLAAGHVDRWPDGVWLVDVGSVTDPSQLPRLTASTLGVLIDPGADEVQTLAARLRDRRLLLCLDTCEHVLDAAATLSERLLRLCPGVSILATSREPLRVEGEAIWRVPSLRAEDAVELFADRAALAAPAFDVNTALTDVRAVCARVDHIPLAVELAAAWVRALQPAQIAAGLDDSLRLLAGGPRGAVPRHRTLRASMAWSHALLDDDERVAFRRMAVFAGSFTVEAVAAICGADGTRGPDALALVGRLLDTSLVTVRGTDRGVRYRLLDTVRQYGEEQLREAGELEAVRDRHLDHFLELVETAEPGLDRDQDTWRDELDSHHDNIHAALRWGLSSPGERADRGRRLAAAMARPWFIRGQAAEGLEFLKRAIDLDPDDRSVLQGQLLAGTALVAMVTGRTALVAEAVDRGLALAEETGDNVSRARCLAVLTYRWFFGDFEQCQATAHEAQNVAVAAGDPFSRDWATIMEAYSMTTRNRHDEATALARLAFERSSPRGDRFCVSFALGVDFWAALETGDLRGAAVIGDEMMRVVTPLGDYFAVGTLASSYVLVSGMTGDIAAGLKFMEPIARSIDEAPESDAVAFEHAMGTLHLWDGDLDNAARWLGRGIERMTEDSSDWTATRCLAGMAAALRRLGRTEEAEEYAAKAVRHGSEYGSPYVLADGLDEQGFLIGGADPGRARELHHEALALRRDRGLNTYLLKSLDALGRLEARAGNHAEATRLLASADAAREAMNHARPPVEQPEHEAAVAALRESLGAAEFESLWHDGSARSLEQTVAAVTRGRGPRNRPTVGWDSLTPTELEVVRLLSSGLSNPEIAARLYMSRSTVKTHLSHVFAKLGVTNRTELATLATSRLTDEIP